METSVLEIFLMNLTPTHLKIGVIHSNSYNFTYHSQTPTEIQFCMKLLFALLFALPVKKQAEIGW